VAGARSTGGAGRDHPHGRRDRLHQLHGRGDRRAFDRIDGHLQRAAADSGVKVVAGGKADDSVGYFIEPTVLEVDNPRHTLMETELFGPVLSVYVYADKQWPEVLALVDGTSPTR
jgi:1-pyrroline-5-carboxylate dehydrogenase